jgi:hypothetical protein
MNLVASAAEWVAAIGTWVAALAAVLAVVLALQLRVRRERRTRPFPTMSFENEPSSAEWAAVSRTGARSLWLRFSVENPPGRNTAREVRVLITHVEAPRERVELVPGGRLLWTDLREPTSDLPAGISRMVDIATIQLPDKEEATTLRLGVQMAPGDPRNVLEPGSYGLELAVTAQDVDAVFYHTSLTFESDWEADPRDLVRHLEVAPLREGPLPR